MILGVVYLDRNDVSLLPAAGIVWTPSDDWRWELVVPRPRIVRRIFQSSGLKCDEFWTYLGGEFGGGVWSIDRADGTQDTATICDFRIVLGLERKVPGELGSRFEVGYVLGRNVEYASDTPDFEPEDAVILRVGANY